MAKSKTASDEQLISLKPSPKAALAVSLLQQAQGITITDRVSHEACRVFLKGAKELKREIVAHYDAIKKPLNAARNTVLDMEKTHLAPVEQAIAVAERVDTAYVREQQRREQEEADRRRREEEAKEQARRDAEAADAEAAALKLEASSNVLSEREQKFVALFTASPIRTIDAAIRCAQKAGYKDPPTQVARFLVLGSKIHTAIANADAAKAIRQESEAKQAAPIAVTVAPVESQIGKVAGTALKTYYSCADVDLRALVLAVAENIQHGDGSMVLALQPDMVYLNAQARNLKEMFSRVWPMATLGKKDGVAG